MQIPIGGNALAQLSMTHLSIPICIGKHQKAQCWTLPSHSLTCTLASHSFEVTQNIFAMVFFNNFVWNGDIIDFVLHLNHRPAGRIEIRTNNVRQPPTEVVKKFCLPFFDIRELLRFLCVRRRRRCVRACGQPVCVWVWAGVQKWKCIRIENVPTRFNPLKSRSAFLKIVATPQCTWKMCPIFPPALHRLCLLLLLPLPHWNSKVSGVPKKPPLLRFPPAFPISVVSAPHPILGPISIRCLRLRIPVPRFPRILVFQLVFVVLLCFRFALRFVLRVVWGFLWAINPLVAEV